MIVENGIIVKCTDDELYQYWLKQWSDIYDYRTYKRLVIDTGTEVKE